MEKFDTTEVAKIIHGKIEPHIYAFQTGTVPNYLKVGDTYRAVETRMDEWRRPGFFPDLIPINKTWSARLDETAYFRDFEVHKYLIEDKKRERLLSGVFPNVYYSKEFFKNAIPEDVDAAVEDITRAYQAKSPKYEVYNLEDKHAREYHYERNVRYGLRPNQAATVDKFVEAKNKGIKKMLMYAVMRFGKSFTSMQCALKMQAKFVLIVSGKADVKEEWKKTVESHVDFKDYCFLTKEDLDNNKKAVTDTLQKQDAPNRAVVFLTLQDLNGDNIKKRHKDIFERQIDLLIIDETHFAARAEKYGRVIENAEQVSAEEKYTVDDVEKYFCKKHIKSDITLHLSGTPYRILMDGEFKQDAIIAFYQFEDIVSDREKWYEENRDNILIGDDSDAPVYEWDNPYFGFPEMIRFAFHPNQAALDRLRGLKDNGQSADFADMFETYSNDKSDENHNKFKYENEVLEFLQVIDGSKDDDNVFAFLDYDKIKDGKMCKHIVMVLPYCGSCDAMAALLKSNEAKFKNLSKYKILNISGFDRPSVYNEPVKIKEAISECESNEEKTITLTVNRLLTGSTVPEWDTMIYLKDTKSPQDYDQAIFRLQSQFVKTYTENGKVLKIDMKPQTLLVDFKPDRMFYLQGKKSGIHNANVNESGGYALEKKVDRDLQISPIIVVNHNKLERVQAPQIIEAISKYSIEKGVFDEAEEIPVDMFLREYNAIYDYICALPAFKSKQGIVIPAVLPEGGTSIEDPALEQKEKDGDGAPDGGTSASGETKTANKPDTNDNFEAKFRTYYANLLYYAFLTEDKINSVDRILMTIESGDNPRIARNLGIDKRFLRLLREKMNPAILGEWDNKIFNINRLANDESIPSLDRALTVIGQLNKISASEVKTPEKICKQMVDLIPNSAFLRIAEINGKILDIASKTGEFALALYQKMTGLGIAAAKIQKSIYSIPTSKMTYEFTLKFYRILGLDTDNIASFTTYDLLSVYDEAGKIDYDKIRLLLTQNKPFASITLNDEVSEGDDMIKFNAVVGNPPYQENDGGGTGSSASALYDDFVKIGRVIDPDYVSMIIKSNWMTGGKGLARFRQEFLSDKHISKLVDHVRASDCFDASQIDGGVCYFLWDKAYSGKCSYTFFMDKDNVTTTERFLDDYSDEMFIRCAEGMKILHKVKKVSFKPLSEYVYPRNTFKIGDLKESDFKKSPLENGYSVLRVVNKKRVTQYISNKTKIDNKELIGKYKVFISKADGAAGYVGLPIDAKVLGEPEFGDVDGICSETFLVIGPFDTDTEAKNLMKYIKTKFFRFLVGLIKQKNMARETYQLVPMQDFTENSDIDWSNGLAEIDNKLYGKYKLTRDEIDFIESMIKPMDK